jgi:multidrug resistance protein, MATE family
MSMSWPIMLSSMSFVIMDFVDKYFVSSLGKDHLAAIGSAGIWAFTLGVLITGITACVSTFTSQSIGRGNKADAARYTWQGVYISLSAIVLILIMWPLTPWLFNSMNHSANVTRLEIDYFNIRMLGVVFIALQTAISSFFFSIERPKIPMYVALFGNLTNIILDYVLIFGKGGFPEMGIEGAALATVISIAAQAVILQYIFMNQAYAQEFETRTTKAFDWPKIKELVKIGWPSGLSGFIDVLNWSVFTSYIIGSFGTEQLAANVAAINYMHIMFMPVMAMNYAIAPIVGQWIGKGDIPRAKARAYTATKIGMVIMLTLGSIVAIYGKELIGLFSDDPEVIQIGHTLLIFAAVFALFDAVNIVLSGALRGAGDTYWMLIALIIGSWGVNIPLAWFFSTPLGLEAKGAWIGATIYIIFMSIVYFKRFHSEKWRHINIFNNGIAK